MKIPTSKFKCDIMIEIFHKIHVDKNGCWLFDNPTYGKGGSYEFYGSIVYKGKHLGAHRAVWIATKGPIPDGMLVLHTCDRPPCCNPDHLFIGTHQDNTQDMIEKDRHPTMKRRI